MSRDANRLDSTLDRMNYGRALKESLLMNAGSESWVPYAQPLLDAVALFEELGIGYALIGAVAAMYYGRARFTEDLDFVAVSGTWRFWLPIPPKWKSITFFLVAPTSAIIKAA